MNIFRISYFSGGLQKLSIVVAEDKEKAAQLVNHVGDFELQDIEKCNLSKENIILTEVYEPAI